MQKVCKKTNCILTININWKNYLLLFLLISHSIIPVSRTNRDWIAAVYSVCLGFLPGNIIKKEHLFHNRYSFILFTMVGFLGYSKA